MKKLIFLCLPIFGMSQVGINTTIPQAGTALHVSAGINGSTVKIDDLPLVTSATYVIVTDADGILKKMLLSSLTGTPPAGCPTLLRNESHDYYLKFSSTSSIQNPNSSVVVNGVTWGFAGTYNQNNLYYYSYTNTSGQGLNINNPFTVQFGSQQCNY